VIGVGIFRAFGGRGGAWAGTFLSAGGLVTGGWGRPGARRFPPELAQGPHGQRHHNGRCGSRPSAGHPVSFPSSGAGGGPWADRRGRSPTQPGPRARCQGNKKDAQVRVLPPRPGGDHPGPGPAPGGPHPIRPGGHPHGPSLILFKVSYSKKKERPDRQSGCRTAHSSGPRVWSPGGPGKLLVRDGSGFKTTRRRGPQNNNTV